MIAIGWMATASFDESDAAGDGTAENPFSGSCSLLVNGDNNPSVEYYIYADTVISITYALRNWGSRPPTDTSVNTDSLELNVAKIPDDSGGGSDRYLITGTVTDVGDHMIYGYGLTAYTITLHVLEPKCSDLVYLTDPVKDGVITWRDLE